METKINSKAFQTEITERGIQYLVHFTPTINLLSIFEQGKILSRALLEQFDISQTDIFDYVEFTDSIRYDDKNFINLSIQHPSSTLFNRFRQRTIEQSHITWCVLKIDPKYIYRKDTLFSVTNAANSHNRNVVKVSGDIEKFRMMFASSLQIVNSYGTKTIQRGNLNKKYTTDEQAEVLVRDEILINDILQVCFKNDIELASVKAALKPLDTSNFVVDSSLFLNTRQ